MTSHSKDVLVELYQKLNTMQIKDQDFDCIVHAIQEIQYLRSIVETYERITKEKKP